jgi:DNA-binding transcriptional regulator YbjK
MTDNTFAVMLADIDDVLTGEGIPGDTSTLRRVKELVARYQAAQAETRREKLGTEYAQQRVVELARQLDAQQKRILALRKELEKYAPAGEVQAMLFETGGA